VAAVVGAGLGLGLAHVSQQREEEHELEALRLAEKTLPQGAPMARGKEADPFAPDPRVMGPFPSYPGTKARQLSSTSKAQGVPMSIAWLQTADSIEQVIGFYDARLAEQHVRHVAHRFNDASGYVAFREETALPDGGFDQGELHMVSAVRQGKQSIVFFSLNRPEDVLHAQAPQLPPGVVLPPNSSPPQLFELGEGGLSRTTIRARAFGASVSEARDFFKTHFQEGGWVLTREVIDGEGASLTAHRGRTQQLVMLGASAGAVDVLVSLDELPSTPEMP
jgi:hypothetical protein